MDLKTKIDEIMEGNLKQETVYSLDFGVNDLKNIYYLLWGVYPTVFDIECDWSDTNINLWHNSEKLNLLRYGGYIRKSEVEEDTKYFASFYVGDHFILGFHYDGIYILAEDTYDYSWITEYLKTTVQSEAPKIFMVVYGSDGFRKIPLKLRDSNFDPKTHYNDDFDIDKITTFINGETSGMVILHGIPGSGKTFYLRHLACTNTKVTFLFMDSNLLSQAGSASFISFLLDNKNCVILLEDCETILQERTSGNDLLKTLLNLSDGILGDGLNIKFICTFNADLSNIDKAVLRKGRLVYKYEFKELCAEKANALAKSLGKPEPNKDIAICEIYNTDDNNGEIPVRNKVGF